MHIGDILVKGLGLLSPLGKRIETIYDLTDTSGYDENARTQRLFPRLAQEYGVTIAYALLLIFPSEIKRMEQIECSILPAKDTGAVMALKESISSDCGMFAVASAIMAQVAITALSLSNLSAMHWSARGAFVTSLVIGALSVYFACRVSTTLSRMHLPSDVLRWLMRQIQSDIAAFIDENKSSAASIHACFILQTPGCLLNLSVVSFLVGLGIYLGSVYSKNLDQQAGPMASRAVLICYVVCTACCQILFFGPGHLKTMEYAPYRRWIRKANEVATQHRILHNASRDFGSANDRGMEALRKTISINGSEESVDFHAAADNLNFMSALQSVVRAQEESAKAFRLMLDRQTTAGHKMGN